MKSLKMEEATAKRLYKSAAPEFKAMLEENFGKDLFNDNITDRIRTYADVCNELLRIGITPKLPYSCPLTKEEISANAFVKIQHISKVLNEGWVADFTNRSQYKYYPWFERTGSGWVVGSCGVYFCYSASLGFGFYYKTEKLALYAGNQFLDIYKEYLPQ